MFTGLTLSFLMLAAQVAPPSIPVVEETRTTIPGTRVRVTYEIHLVNKRESIHYIDMCSNSCNGLVHPAHEKCDNSCDTHCESEHAVVLEPKFSRGFGAPSSTIRALSEQAGREETDALLRAMEDRVKAAFRPGAIEPELALATAATAVSGPRQHFVPSPCTRATCYIKIDLYDAEATVVVTEKGKSIAEGDINLGAVTIPKDGLSYLYNEQCYCSKEAIPGDGSAQDALFFGDPPLEMKPDGDAELPYPFGPANLLHDLSGDNMNGLDGTLNPPFDQGFDCQFNPGLEFVPDDPAVQVLVLILPVASAPEDSLYASTAFENLLAHKLSFKTMCTEIKKHEPSRKTKFRIAMPRNPLLTRLAQSISKQRFIGPTDQAKMWIAADKATYDQIRKRLIPGPTPGTYLRALSDVATLANVNPFKSPFKACLEPKLISDSSTRDAVEWFFAQLERPEAKELIDGFMKELPTLGKLSESTNENDAKHLVNVVRSMAISSNPKLRAAMYDLLEKHIPKAQRPRMGGIGILAPLGDVFFTEDAAQAERVFNLSTDYGALSMIGPMSEPNPKLPEALRTKSIERAKETKPE